MVATYSASAVRNSSAVPGLSLRSVIGTSTWSPVARPSFDQTTSKKPATMVSAT